MYLLYDCSPGQSQSIKGNKYSLKGYIDCVCPFGLGCPQARYRSQVLPRTLLSGSTGPCRSKTLQNHTKYYYSLVSPPKWFEILFFNVDVLPFQSEFRVSLDCSVLHCGGLGWSGAVVGWRRRWSCSLGALKPPNPAVLNLCLPAPGQDHLCCSVTPTNYDLGTFAHFTPLETQRNLVSDASFLRYFLFWFYFVK